MRELIIGKCQEGVYHLTNRSSGEMSFLRRYDLITIPEITDVCAEIPGFSFECDWEGWQDELAALKEQFPAQKQAIIGTPEENETYEDFVVQEHASDCHFAIRFPVTQKERFYGLGEGARSEICLNGAAYQNFVKYQADEIPTPFVMSTGGWGVAILADGRHFVDVNSRGNGYLSCIGADDPLDVLVFKADCMAEILKLYTAFAGRPMVLPRWGYGLTYIAPIFANQFEVLADAQRMKELGIPCEHFSLEPGWMTKFYDMSFEKEWNLERFHVPTWLRKPEKQHETFIGALKRMGIHLSLWLCMDYDVTDEAERVGGYRKENQYPRWYDHLQSFVNTGISGFKIDPANMLDPYKLQFDLRTNTEQACSNGQPFEHMHNVNQVLLAKQMYEGFAQQTGLRPMLHYCGGYTGIQRWVAATTGDNGGREGAMIWLLNLALSGCSNTTVDMDIFSPASMHFAFFAPWAHLNAWSGVRQPWYAGEDAKQMFVRYARLRNRLMPYLYSAALQAHVEGMPIIRPLPLVFEKDERLARMTEQYMVGDWLMVGCFTDNLTLPKVEWVDAWTGEKHEAGKAFAYDIPEAWGGALMIRSGAILPTQDGEGQIVLHLFPQEAGKSASTFYEDDGVTLDYHNGGICKTMFEMTSNEEAIELRIGTREGEFTGKPASRIWQLVVHDGRKVDVVIEDANDSYITVTKEDENHVHSVV